MVKRVINFLGREIKGLHEAAYLLAGFTFLSQILGLVRDRLLASMFGASALVDVYYAAFRLPDLLFVLVTSFISVSVLVPLLSKHIDDGKYLKRMVDSLFSVFIFTTVILSLIVFIFAPYLLKWMVPGLASGAWATDLILFTRILLISPILLGASQMFGSIVQSYRKFFVYAISPVLYNLGIILGIIFLYPVFGNVGLVYGVILGAIFHVLIQVPTVAKHELVPRLTFRIDWGLIKDVVLISFPRAITLASTQIMLLVMVALASLLAVGSIAIFNFSYNLQAVPLAIIGVSYSLAAFPTLSRLYANGRTEEFLSHLITAARHIIFWSLPVISMFIVLRAQIVRTIFGSGEFDWNDTRLTAAALAIFSISVLAQSLVLLFVRAYYSAGKTKKPLVINVVSMIITLASAIFLVDFFNQSIPFRQFFENLLRIQAIPGTVVLMLPLAFSIGTLINGIWLWISFERDFRGFSGTLWRTLVQSLIAAIIAGYVAYFWLQILATHLDLNTLAGIFSQGLIAGLIGLAAATGVLFLLRNPEVKEITKALHSKIWRTRPIVVDQEDISG